MRGNQFGDERAGEGAERMDRVDVAENQDAGALVVGIEGLKDVKSPEDVARLRGKSIEEILG